MQGSAEVAQLEQLVGVFYSGAEQSQIAFAAASLDELRSRWWHAGPWLLLEQTVGAHASAPTVLWTSSLVEQWVRKRWHRISDSDRAACRASLVNLVSTSAAAAAAAASAAAAAASPAAASAAAAGESTRERCAAVATLVGCAEAAARWLSEGPAEAISGIGEDSTDQPAAEDSTNRPANHSEEYSEEYSEYSDHHPAHHPVHQRSHHIHQVESSVHRSYSWPELAASALAKAAALGAAQHRRDGKPEAS